MLVAHETLFSTPSFHSPWILYPTTACPYLLPFLSCSLYFVLSFLSLLFLFFPLTAWLIIVHGCPPLSLVLRGFHPVKREFFLPRGLFIEVGLIDVVFSLILEFRLLNLTKAPCHDCCCELELYYINKTELKWITIKPVTHSVSFHLIQKGNWFSDKLNVCWLARVIN